MRRLSLLLLVTHCSLLVNTAVAQNKLAPQLRNGDIILQRIPCGSLCQAIIETTPCAPGKAYNHCGIIHQTKEGAFVIEAIGKAVKETLLDSFLKREPGPTVAVARVRKGTADPEAAVQKARQYLGVPYDDQFLPGDSALYCSELVWESFEQKNRHSPLFVLAPMTFKSPATGTTYPAWAEYYRELGAPIPEGRPGINPCAIANSAQVELLELQR